MRFYFLLALLISFCFIGAQVQKTEIITLEQAMEKFLPEFEIEQRIFFMGKGLDFAYAKETGEILAVIEVADSVFLRYLLPDGCLKWEQKFRKASFSCCHISDNGKGVTFSQEEYDERYLIENYAFDSEGDILFERKQKESLLLPSPAGDYFYFRYRYIEPIERPIMEIFNKYGYNVGNFPGNSEFYDSSLLFLEKDIFLFFYTESYYSPNKMVLCKIENDSITALWEKDIVTLSKSHPIIDLDMICYEKPYICLSTLPFKVINLEGKEIFDFESLLSHAYVYSSFLDKNSCFLLSHKDKTARFFDLMQNKVIDSFTWQYVEYLFPESSRIYQNNIILGNYGMTLFVERSTNTYYSLDYKMLSNLTDGQLILVNRAEDTNIIFLRRSK